MFSIPQNNVKYITKNFAMFLTDNFSVYHPKDIFSNIHKKLHV
jgi:hypothetical protein